MREILFRGKRKDNGEWVFGWYSCITKGAHYDPIDNAHFITTSVKLDNGEIILTGMFEVDPDTVEHYTGLLDKNETKIFEGDIVKHKDGRAFKITWHDRAFCLTADIIGTSSRFETLWNLYSDEIEVIGNIHDNPELLEETR
jgi:uncharacterized phage protein (TIGR01671 family)